MDSQIPQLMGVSKAILENVIFCHQDDNNWPLGSMGDLKKKFDDLFGATRYTKALKAISEVRKQIQETKKDQQHQAESSRFHRDQAKGLRNQLEEVEKAAHISNEEKKNLLEELHRYQETTKSLQSLYDSIQAYEVEFCSKQHLITQGEEEMALQQKEMTEIYEESVEQLMEYQNQFQKEIL
ncbi:hypothetical protein IE077_000853, partial [Cardiosporidium cionae]